MNKPELNVTCPNCGESWLTTTDRFSPDKCVHAAMFRLKQQYRDQGWSFCNSEFPNDSIMGEQVIYPCCGVPMCDSNYRFNGRLSLPEKQGSNKKYVCDVCSASFDYAVALAGHMRGVCGKHETVA